MFDHRCAVADDPRNERLTFGQARLLPHLPFVRMARVAGLKRVRARAYPQHEIDNVLQRNIGDVRAGPATPAQVISDPIRWNAA